MKRLVGAAILLSFAHLACYNTYTIPRQELDRLESGQEREDVEVQSVDGEIVEISPETPLEVQTTTGETHRVTPYNFLLSESQLVAPDYDLLLQADAVASADIREISYGKTFGLVGGIVAAVAGGFVALALTQ